MAGLKSSEIHWLVHTYIGVEGGYLGDFSYRTHREFYPGYCDLDINLDQVPGSTTREKFCAVLVGSAPHIQAAILRGVAKRFPAESERTRTPAAFRQLHELAKRCADGAAVAPTSPAISSEVVEHALKDAAALLETRGPISAMDRVHTALHGYLKAACVRISLEVPPQAATTLVFKLLRQNHPGLSDLGAQHDSLIKILQGMSQVIDGVSTQRNNASLAHANDELLRREDALLAINSARTLIQYLDTRFLQEHENQTI
jgi:hypothetical protein